LGSYAPNPELMGVKYGTVDLSMPNFTPIIAACCPWGKIPQNRSLSNLNTSVHTACILLVTSAFIHSMLLTSSMVTPYYINSWSSICKVEF